MQKVSLLLAVLACAGHVRTVQGSDEKLLADLLHALKPSEAFNPSTPGTPRSSNSFDQLGLKTARNKDGLKPLGRREAIVAGASFLAAAAAMMPDDALAKADYTRCWTQGVRYRCEKDRTFDNALAYVAMAIPGFVRLAPYFIYNKEWKEYLAENPDERPFEGKGDNVKWNWPKQPLDPLPIRPGINGKAKYLDDKL